MIHVEESLNGMRIVQGSMPRSISKAVLEDQTNIANCYMHHVSQGLLSSPLLEVLGITIVAVL